MNRKTVYILDDDPNFVDSLVWLLEDQNYQSKGFVESHLALDSLKSVSTVNLACLILDVRMPEINGLEFHDQLKDGGIDLPIIYLTGHGDVALAVEAMSKGALSFIEKPVDHDELLSVLEIAFSANVQSQRLSAENRLLAVERSERIASLTGRETEVLSGIVEGFSARKIGEELFISTKTVDFHRGNIMKKLKAKNIAHLQRIMALSTASADQSGKPDTTGEPAG